MQAVAFDNPVELFSVKYPKAIDCLKKVREELLAFYDFPAEHWLPIRTTNPFESSILLFYSELRKVETAALGIQH